MSSQRSRQEVDNELDKSTVKEADNKLQSKLLMNLVNTKVKMICAINFQLSVVVGQMIVH